MLPIRRAATSKVARAATTSIVSRSIHLFSPATGGASRLRTVPSLWRTALVPSQQLHRFPSSPPFVALRSYATGDAESEDKVTVESAADAVEEVKEEAEETIEGVREAAADHIDAVQEEAAEAVAEAREDAAEAATAAATAAAAATATSTSSDDFPQRTTPSQTRVYVGNVTFEATEDMLKEAFDEIAPVLETRIVYDGRGLSRGFAFVTFASPEGAKLAVDKMHLSEFNNRRIVVQPAVYKQDNKATSSQSAPGGVSGPRNPPTKTIFVGNLSYEMTDRDLNELFRSVRNVLEVRVAVDRRTSQPRGFAHADFVDVESAQTAAEQLRGKTYYGRQLRVDFANRATRDKTFAAPASGDGVPPSS